MWIDINTSPLHPGVRKSKTLKAIRLENHDKCSTGIRIYGDRKYFG